MLRKSLIVEYLRTGRSQLPQAIRSWSASVNPLLPDTAALLRAQLNRWIIGGEHDAFDAYHPDRPTQLALADDAAQCHENVASEIFRDRRW